jgi:CDP-paratose 2-epimerase
LCRQVDAELAMTKRILVTGGAGFVGSNLTNSLLTDGFDVTVFDALVRAGSQENLAWLRQCAKRLHVVYGDVRDFKTVRDIVADADIIYHLAGQVAVTSSVSDPRSDFETNALGTLNVLEAAREGGRQPIIMFASTNKVYGGMKDVPVVEGYSRYSFTECPNGISEAQPLDFHSPYGCSKGAADQYVRDYGRIYDLPTVVFRMSCIYGPRQFGTEDQGWVAHFIISALTERSITIYGNGKQVRDVLFVDDLVRVFRLATDRIDKAAGEVFNIGGGPCNTISVWAEFGQLLAKLAGRDISVDFDGWRPGDQPCYVSDIRKAGELLDWYPRIDKETGVRRLWEWASSNLDILKETKVMRRAGADAVLTDAIEE